MKQRFGRPPEDDAGGDSGSEEHREVRRVGVRRFGVGAAEFDVAPRPHEEEEAVQHTEQHRAEEHPAQIVQEDGLDGTHGGSGRRGEDELCDEEQPQYGDRHAERRRVLPGEEAPERSQRREVSHTEEVRCAPPVVAGLDPVLDR